MSKIVKKNEKSALSEEPINKKSFPFILIKFMPESDINIIQNENKSQLVLHSTKQFDVMNENHLFEGMGVTKIKSKNEFESLFGQNLRKMLISHKFTDKIFD
jgi:hypothetical protein